MSRRTLGTRKDICHMCDFLLLRYLPIRQRWRPQNSSHTFTTLGRQHAQMKGASCQSAQVAWRLTRLINSDGKRSSENLTETQLENHWQEVKVDSNSLLSLATAPSEQETLRVLTKCNRLAEILILDQNLALVDGKSGATSALLSLDASTSAKKIAIPKTPTSIQRMANELSRLVFSVVEHPTIFITPKVLEIYTKIQACLRRPETFPAVFHMYANKPLPLETSPIRYSRQNPNKVANAVPVSAANRALQIAIDSKQLVVAMDIVESAYNTRAFHRAKFVRKCLLPATGIVVAPAAAYTIASQLALLQTTMDTEMATHVAFAGILAYTFFTGTIGVVAITTANDQMDRVTWAQGMPLRERWIREEERAAIDKIAGSWGFRESWRRGEEEGEDWDALREWIGRKGMILDRVELMEGME